MNSYKLTMIIKRTPFLPLLVLALITFSHELAATEKLVFNSGSSSPFCGQDGSGFNGRIVKEVFRRLNIETETIYLPAERSLINANKGIEDGVIARVKGMEKKYPNLIRVPEKVMDFEFVAYTNNIDITVDGWDSFKPFEVAFIKGWKLLETHLPHAKRIYKVKGPMQLFGLLESDRVQVIIYERWGALWWIKELKADVTLLEPPVAKREMFMYLHKSHVHLVPRASKALADMKKDGTYQRIFDETLSVLN